MSEIPSDQPEVVVESREIAREDVEQIVSAIERAASLMGERYTYLVEPKSEGGQAYNFQLIKEKKYSQNTRRTGDDAFETQIIIFKGHEEGEVGIYFPALLVDTLRYENGDIIADLSYIGGNDYSSEPVSRLVCEKKTCTNTEGALIQEKVNELIVGLLQPKLDKLETENKARRIEEGKAKQEAAEAEAARKAEEARKNSPATKAKEF